MGSTRPVVSIGRRHLPHRSQPASYSAAAAAAAPVVVVVVVRRQRRRNRMDERRPRISRPTASSIAPRRRAFPSRGREAGRTADSPRLSYRSS